MTVTEVSEYLRIPVKTLYKYAQAGTGPACMRVGRHLRYRRADVDLWLEGLAA